MNHKNLQAHHYPVIPDPSANLQELQELPSTAACSDSEEDVNDSAAASVSVTPAVSPRPLELPRAALRREPWIPWDSWMGWGVSKNLEKHFLGLNVHQCTPLIHGMDPVGSTWRSKNSASVKPCKQIDSNATPRRLQLPVGFDQFCALLHIPTIHLEDQIEKSYTFNTSC